LVGARRSVDCTSSNCAGRTTCAETC
jgi:hypothetical protein